jgi:hypothetical protein
LTSGGLRRCIAPLGDAVESGRHDRPQWFSRFVVQIGRHGLRPVTKSTGTVGTTIRQSGSGQNLHRTRPSESQRNAIRSKMPRRVAPMSKVSAAERVLTERDRVMLWQVGRLELLALRMPT